MGARGRPASPSGRVNLTGRAAVLALVVCLLAISLAYPLREYLRQRGDIATVRAQVVDQQRTIADLRRQQRHWKDPTFVEREARRRLHFVMPGETSYIVLGPEDASAERVGGPDSPTVRTAWFTRLWNSVEVAGRQ